MSDLTLTEQKHVRTAMRVLRRKLGTRSDLAKALQYSPATIRNILDGTNAVSAGMAFRVARLVELPIDDLLAGRCLPGACPRCGYLPDFADEETNVDAVPSLRGSRLALVP
jgi:DNA-binding XRE family transcriptional regulator